MLCQKGQDFCRNIAKYPHNSHKFVFILLNVGPEAMNFTYQCAITVVVGNTFYTERGTPIKLQQDEKDSPSSNELTWILIGLLALVLFFYSCVITCLYVRLTVTTRLDSVPYCRCPPPGLGIAAATGTTDLTAAATGNSIDNRCGNMVHSDYVFNIPRNLVKALPEVELNTSLAEGSARHSQQTLAMHLGLPSRSPFAADPGCHDFNSQLNPHAETLREKISKRSFIENSVRSKRKQRA
ncbi:hypothetical protein CHARACLAT_024953 [Characodon lateralis]|uniref:Uncharacterized protein n=1 Tax=Characodon lateralis TaxID=208331 RepID=A0ABU7EQA3_9TELE|nr:hypothetical protein [Characodon lateralis]